MIIYSELGNNGRLGNQMFQYAALYGVGFLRGYDIGIPADGHDLSNVFNITANTEKNLSYQHLYKETSFSHDSKVNLISDNTNMHGYFQSPYYWLHCEDSIRKEFAIKEEINSPAKILIESERREGRPLCSFHVRRSDYIEKSDYHHLQSLAYYKKAVQVVLSQIPNTKFLCFSDDIEWCKQTFGENKNVIYFDNHPYIDFACMSQCDIHVMANSSFSWWAAFLSRSKAVISPAKWFGPSGPDNWQTIYCQGWHQVGD